MKRRMISIAVILLWVLAMPAAVFAQADAPISVCAGYLAGDTVYVFGHFSQEDSSDQEMSLVVTNQERGSACPVSVSESNAPTRYMLLVDVSTSMAPYKGLLNRFVSELMAVEGCNLSVTIAAFDREFRVVASDLTQWEDVQKELWSLQYQNDGSNICGSVADALVYLGGKSYSGGELCNLVVITDGKPWYSNDAAAELAQENQNAQKAAAVMGAYPDLVVHTLCFQGWEEKTGEVLLTGKGMHMQSPSLSSAGEAGKSAAEFTSNLYSLQFPLMGYGDTALISDAMLLGAKSQWISLGNIRNVAIAPVLPEEFLPQQDPADESPTEGTAPTEETGTVEETTPTEEAEPTESTNPAAETSPVVMEDLSASDAMGSLVPLIIAGAVGVCTAFIILIVVILRKKRMARDSVRMRVEVLSGDVSNLKKVYFLHDSFVIGTGRKCDIVLHDAQAAPVNTRIFMQDQIIYIEDMHSPNGTTLNGMRIYSSNRLRSGDQIGVGNVTLQFLF